MTNNTIKCGRETYNLQDGDTVMDNGSCYQLISRTIRKGWDSYSPRVSKKAFNEFIKNPQVSINNNHNYGESVTLYTFKSNKEG